MQSLVPRGLLHYPDRKVKYPNGDSYFHESGFMEQANQELNKRVKQANQAIYNNLSASEYNRNESIFNERRRSACDSILLETVKNSGNESFLDLGTGTGNLLRLAQQHFKCCIGLDIGERLLQQIKDDFPSCHLVSGDVEALPFPSGQFNCVSCYAVLHHLALHEQLFRECFRVLKPGGCFYTDHDPNYFFSRYYRLYYRLRFQNRHGFGSEDGDLAEYHNVFTDGLNPETLRSLLLYIGFRKVKIYYRLSDRERWGPLEGLAFKLLSLGARLSNWRSFHTHFALLAHK